MFTDPESAIPLSTTENFSIFQFFKKVTKTHCMQLKLLYNKSRCIKPRQKYEIVCTPCPLCGHVCLSSALWAFFTPTQSCRQLFANGKSIQELETLKMLCLCFFMLWPAKECVVVITVLTVTFPIGVDIIKVCLLKGRGSSKTTWHRHRKWHLKLLSSF